ncbi:MAG: SUMF1/EgtB/PvdO family nonheme iron enzyme [Anaerolineales bacterium]|nr:SUMF1/EgtB/PvdO family nonheme iron enzyme [Anaerolineales bacterium]
MGTKSCVEDTSRIGSYPPNGFGLYDMAGNVWEWVADWYDVYPGGDLQASDGFGQKYRVYRGGSWYFGEDSLRVSIRFARDSSKSDFYLGFRCVRDINP